MALWPPSLKAYVARCFQKCVTDVDKKQIEIFLKSKVAKAVGEEMLWTNNWDEEPMPVQHREQHRSYFPYSVPPPVIQGYKYNSQAGSSSAYKFNSQAGNSNFRRTVHNSERPMISNQVTRKPVAILPEKMTDYKKMNGRSATMKSLEASGILHRSQHLRQKEEILRRGEEHLRRGEQQLSVIKKQNRKRSTSREKSSLQRGRTSPTRERERWSKLSGTRSGSCKRIMLQERRSRSRGRRSRSRDRFQEREKGRELRKMMDRLQAEKDRRREPNEREGTWERKREAMGKEGCQTCTRSKHGEKPCPALWMDCFDCGKIGHLRKSAACHKNKKGGINSRQTLRSVESWDSTSELVKHVRDKGHVELVKQNTKATTFGGKGNVDGSIAPIHEVPHTATATTEDPEAAMESSRQRQKEHEDLRQKLRCIMSGAIPAILPELVNEVKTRDVLDDLDHQTQEFIKSKAKVTPFGGKGNILGSIATTLEPPPTIEDSEAATEAAQIKVDEPVTSVQVRLEDGSRIVVKLNHSHTVGDIRTFIIMARPEYNGVPFSLVTTIPLLEPSLLHKELTQDQQTLKEAQILGASILQRIK